MFQLLEAQAEYHRRSLAALEAAIPTIHMQQGEEVQQERLVDFMVGWRDGCSNVTSAHQAAVPSLPSALGAYFNTGKSPRIINLSCHVRVQFSVC